MTERVIAKLKEKGIETAEFLPLFSACSFRVGGVARLAVYPQHEEALAEALAILREAELPVTVIGRGTNLFFGDGQLSGALVLTERMRRVECEGTTLFADCGVSLATLATVAAEHSLTGLEFARGIPGSLGGAIFMNAGAYGSCMAEVTLSTRAMDQNTGEIFRVTEHDFGYRESIYRANPHWLCLGAELSLREGVREEIEQTMAELARKRRESQPLEYPSAGSFFKRPEGHFAGKLIEDAGLKGRQIGGARVSEKHAGFLINAGGATAADIRALAQVVVTEVKERFGVTLEPEALFVPTDEA